MRVLLPEQIDPASVDDIGRLYAYPEAGLVRANMVSSLDGAVSADGRSKPISGPADMFMFGLLRALADVIVVGAGTARTEGYGPGRAREEFAHLRKQSGQDPAPTIAIITRSAHLDPEAAIFTNALTPTIVITCRSAAEERRTHLAEVADVHICGDETVDLPRAIALLRERGMRRVLCEGGPSLLGDLTSEGLVDELALTLSPTVAGGHAGRILTTQQTLLQPMRSRALLEQDGYLFGLYERGERP